MPVDDKMIARIARKYRIPVTVFRALVRQESGGNPRAVSPAGAQGLTQLMPATARGLGVTDPFDPAQNLDGGARYLRQQLDRFGTLPLALAAYNAGPGAVEKHGGVPPYSETQAYVRSILGASGSGAPAAPAAPRTRGGAAAPETPHRRRALLGYLLGGDWGSFLDELGSAPRPAAPAPTPSGNPGSSVTGGGGGSFADPGGFNPAFKSALDRLLEATGGKVTVRSGYRSVDEQRRLWEDALRRYGSEAAARKWVAPPGRSRHNVGLAADLAGDLRLAARLAPRFGLTFPLGNEPWHVELAGAR